MKLFLLVVLGVHAACRSIVVDTEPFHIPNLAAQAEEAKAQGRGQDEFRDSKSVFAKLHQYQHKQHKHKHEHEHEHKHKHRQGVDKQNEKKQV